MEPKKKRDMPKLPTPFGAFRAKSNQHFKVSGDNFKCLKLKCRGTAVNLELDKHQRALVVKKDYEGKQPTIYFSFSINIHVKAGSGSVGVYRDGISIGSLAISGPGQYFLATDFTVSQPVVKGTKLSLCFESSSTTLPLKLTVKNGIVGLTT